MGVPYPIVGPPGAQTARRVSFRQVFQYMSAYLAVPGGVYISGTGSRDSGNTGDLDVLRPGLLMGMDTTTGYYQPSILGVTTGAYSSGGVSITVSAAQAVEIVRRVGSTGNLTYVGPPTANGTNAVTTSIAYSAVNVTTGVITTSSIGVDKVAGSFVTDTDGTGLPRVMIPDGCGIKVSDNDGASVAAVQWPNAPIAGVLLAEQLLYWPTDTSLQAWIISSLNAASGGQYIFSDYRYTLYQ